MSEGKISVLRAREDMEMDVDFERTLSVTNIDYDEYGATIYTQEVMDADLTDERVCPERLKVLYYFVLNEELIDQLIAAKLMNWGRKSG